MPAARDRPPPAVTALLVAIAAVVALLATGCATDEPSLTAPPATSPEDTAPPVVLEVAPPEAAPEPPAAEPEPPPVPLVVLDTDLGSDVDDALALAMVHRYADLGRVELAAVTISRGSGLAARYAATVNALADRPEVAVGIDRAAAYTFDDTLSYVSLADELAAAGGIDGAADAGGEPEDAVPVIRRVLAGAAEQGRPVVLIQVGFAGNLAALLDSGPDAASPLTGSELVVAADASLSIMAGSFDPRPADPSPVRTPGHVEFNVAQDVDSARRVVAEWPTELVLAPFELGDVLPVPYTAIANELAPDHPLRRAYEYRDLDWHVDAPPFYDMRSWDLTAVVQAIEPAGGWFPLSAPGTVTIDAEGFTSFAPGPGAHRILEIEPMSADQRGAAVDRMVELVLGTGAAGDGATG